MNATLVSILTLLTTNVLPVTGSAPHVLRTIRVRVVRASMELVISLVTTLAPSPVRPINMAIPLLLNVCLAPVSVPLASETLLTSAVAVQQVITWSTAQLSAPQLVPMANIKTQLQDSVTFATTTASLATQTQQIVSHVDSPRLAPISTLRITNVCRTARWGSTSIPTTRVSLAPTVVPRVPMLALPIVRVAMALTTSTSGPIPVVHHVLTVSLSMEGLPMSANLVALSV